jgi:hypothetical protein
MQNFITDLLALIYFSFSRALLGILVGKYRRGIIRRYLFLYFNYKCLLEFSGL